MMLPVQQLGAIAVESSPALEKVSWTWPPYIIGPLVCFAFLYGIGAVKLRRRSSRLGISKLICFVLGWLSLLLALDSPMHEISEQLFWVHMTQHEVLVLVSAPLLVLARPMVSMLWAFPDKARASLGKVSTAPIFRRVWIFISAPVAAWLLHALALWIWHAPVLFIATLHGDLMHAAQHSSFLGTALLFWWALLENHGGRLGYGGAILYVFTTAIHTSVLGAWLTFSQRVWYTPYIATAPAWHITALQDQQLGGLIMWVPAGALLTVIGLALLVKFLAESERRWEYTRTAELIRSSARSQP